MIIQRKKWRARYRGPGVCELCGLPVRARECFHILAKGQGGGSCLDVVLNCLSSCAAFSGGKDCHTRHHAGNLAFNGQKFRTEELLAIVAHREGISLDVDLLEILWWIGRLPKEANQDETVILNRAGQLKKPEREVAMYALKEAGKVAPMTLEQMDEDYQRWLESTGQKESLEPWLRTRLHLSTPSERIQLRTFCAMRGKAQVYDGLVVSQ